MSGFKTGRRVHLYIFFLLQCLSIIVHFSKMDKKYQHGDHVLVVELGLSPCLLLMLVKYNEVTYLITRISSQIIHGIVSCKNEQIKEKYCN